jgi:hypothetical protein
MRERLQRRLKEAERVLRELRRTYGKASEFYQDQLDSKAAPCCFVMISGSTLSEMLPCSINREMFDN